MSRYNFKSDPRTLGATVLLSANDSSYTGTFYHFFRINAILREFVQIQALVYTTKDRHIQQVSGIQRLETTLALICLSIAWFQEHGAGVQSGGTAGRSFYTSLGHLNETWQVMCLTLNLCIQALSRIAQDDLFLAHVMGGIGWALQSNTTRAFNSSGLIGNSPSASTSSTAAPSYVISSVAA